MLRRILTWLLLVLVLFTGVGALWFAYWYQGAVVLEPGEHVSKDAILNIISQESPVLYRDGEERLGVFFSQEHRVYVPYEEIPQAWIDAIVAAEDKNFWTHWGLDLEGIARAMWLNIKAGRVVAGGSTLTQQTAKNLYYRPDRSMRSKLEEAVNALRLEAHHSKEDILEYYANQFHVSSNGRGLGIGARYFFDKEVSELTTQECAFLAGLVKAPSRYNPFIARSEERRGEARQKAEDRTRYVLARMQEEGSLSRADFEVLSERSLSFRRGRFRYESNVMLDAVRRRLEQSPFPELFEQAGIDNPSTAGIQIRTTLDSDAQRAATYGLWHHLTDVGLALEGSEGTASAFAQSSRPSDARGNRPPEPREFVNARVVGVGPSGVELDVAGYPGWLDAEAIDRVAGILARAAKGNRWARPTDTHRAQMSAVLVPGTVVWVSIRPEQGSGEGLLCDLELRPELQGAVLLVEEGAIRAMVGGNDNRNFNRALDAHRQLGSTWKTLVYASALQLGWTPTDLLDNRRAVFPFEGTFYYPRPDHPSDDQVSMAWSGVRSENLATIWLLYHLADRLTPEQVRELAEAVDLAPRQDERREDYIRRIRDGQGIIALQSRVEAGLLNGVRQTVADQVAEGRWPQDALEVRSLHYGLGFEKERKQVLAMPEGEERTERLSALAASLTWLEASLSGCQQRLDGVRASVTPTPLAEPSRLLRWLFGDSEPVPPAAQEAMPPVDPALLKGLWFRPSGERLEVACGEQLTSDWAPLDPEALARLQVPGSPILDDDPWVEGRLHASTLRILREAIDGRKAWSARIDPWDPELLYLHPDFRVMLALRFLTLQARSLGVEADIPPVLSMPLGAVDVRLEEAVNLYEGLLSGVSWRFPGERYEAGAVPGLRVRRPVEAPSENTLLIQEIRDRDGNVLYRARSTASEVMDPVSSALTRDILKNVVQHGTGRLALQAARGWGLGGKTGTTNDFRNAAFLGEVPRVREGKVSGHFVLGVYVGYDDNRRMTRGTTRLHGASGALPVWTSVVAGLRAEGLMGEGPPDESPVQSGFSRVPVAPGTGAPVAEGVAEGEHPTRSVLVHGDMENLHRRFAPFGHRPQIADDDIEPVPLPLQEALPRDTAQPEDRSVPEVEMNPWGIPVSEDRP